MQIDSSYESRSRIAGRLIIEQCASKAGSNWTARRDNFIRVVGKQPGQLWVDLHHNTMTQFSRPPNVAHKVNRIAKALLSVDEERSLQATALPFQSGLRRAGVP